MNIIQITVRAGRTFNHPHEQYANLRPEVELTATVVAGEDADTVTRALQAKAEALVEQNKAHLLKQMNDLYESAQVERELSEMEATLGRAQSRMEDLKRRRQELALPESVG